MTDADLVLGKLDPQNFAGGKIVLSADAATTALTQAIGDILEMAPQKAAVGVIEVVDENMASAARAHAVENGKELGDFTMIAYGGAAPLHANRLCEKAGHRYADDPAWGGRRIGDRVPARAVRIRSRQGRVYSADPIRCTPT